VALSLKRTVSRETVDVGVAVGVGSVRHRVARHERPPFHVKRSSVVSDLERRLAAHEVDAGAAAPLATLLELLEAPSAPTSVHDPRLGVDVHIADSLSGLEIPELRSAGTIADLGAGGGLPGLVLAAVLPTARVVLVESLNRKCAFLRDATEAMELPNVAVVCARAEEWTEGAGACDVVTARALAALPVIYEYAAPLLRPEGVVVAWKGELSADEAADGAAAAAVLGLGEAPPRSVRPFAGSERRTLRTARKVAPTPARFPRRPGIATKRPLSVKNLR
jgi:16S rRNA (guanine527-N7)-methyltransferase